MWLWQGSRKFIALLCKWEAQKSLTGKKLGQKAFKKSFSSKVVELPPVLKFDFTFGLLYGIFWLSDFFYDIFWRKNQFLGIHLILILTLRSMFLTLIIEIKKLVKFLPQSADFFNWPLRNGLAR
jgi:hypothetical protein